MRLIDADETIRAITRKFDEDFLSVGDAIETIDNMPSAQPEPTVHYEEMINKHSFCDFVRDWMSKKLDPTVIRPEEMTHKMLYRSWVELWWLLDHYFEHEPPKWGDEKDGESA